MATLEEMRNDVLKPLDDESITAETVDALINECLRLVARKTLLSDLESTGTFDTVLDDYKVPIPEAWNFSRNLFKASIATGRKITVLTSIEILANIYPNYDVDYEKGELEYVVVSGSNLIYYPIPTTIKTVSTKFYKHITPLVKDTDSPTFLPEDFHNELCVNYALWKIWSKIEDGIEGAKVNTNYHRNEFRTYMNELDDDIDHGQSRPEPLREKSWI